MQLTGRELLSVMGYEGDPDQKMPGRPWTWREWTVTEDDELHRKYNIPTLQQQMFELGRKFARERERRFFKALAATK